MLGRHLQAFADKSVDGIMEDYAGESVLIIPSGPLCGLDEIRKFFAGFIGTLPAGFLEAFKMNRQEIIGEVGYIVWEAAPWVNLATDTFLVRNNKIMVQTFAAYPA